MRPGIVEFLDDVQLRFQRTKIDWAVKLEDFTRRLSSHDHHHHRPKRSTALPNPLQPLTPFRVLLQLHADEDVIENGKLDAVFDLDDGRSITFFVPQLLSFLLHGALYKSQNLEEWILKQCHRNVYFAHRCYWFLRAWCLEVPVQQYPASRRSSKQRLSLLSNASDNEASNRGLVPFLDEPVSPESSIPCGPRRLRRGDQRRQSSAYHNQMHSTSPVKLLPEERAVIETLMLRVKECGETAASVLAFGRVQDDILNQKEYKDHVEVTEVVATENGGWYAESFALDGFTGTDIGSSPSQLMSAAESGVIPIDPRTGLVSLKHLDCVSARQRYGFLPTGKLPHQQQWPISEGVGEGSRAMSPSSESHHSETEQFDKTPQFLDALIFLADRLFQVPPQERKAELRNSLREIECELLPSNSIYMPIGNVHHRVWRVVADESIPIGTKERVPCFVCLEVVDFAEKKLQPRAWSFLDRLPRRAAGQRSTSTESVDSRESASPVGAERDNKVPFSFEGIHLFDVSEAELVADWMHEKRDPLRRTSLLDKVTDSVVDSVKAPLDKMKVLGSYQERSVNEELRSLVMGDPIMEQPSQEASEFSMQSSGSRSDEVMVDLENVGESHGNHNGAMSRVSSAGSLVSLGQWTSPEPVERRIVGSLSSENGVRRRLSDALADESDRSLPYGSDHEDDINAELPSPSKTKSVDSEGSSKRKIRRPPVVFRESWKHKQERIRSKSAYGSHPGWRLLTVLVKANDDLRQEQLASQLIYRMAAILARDKIPVWLCPYDIIALTDSGGIVEAIPDTISLDSLKRNDPNYRGLKYFFLSHFGDATEDFADAQANFVESLAAYSVVCFLLQVKDRVRLVPAFVCSSQCRVRSMLFGFESFISCLTEYYFLFKQHNGNILLDNRGHLVHIDFGFFFLSSPGKNAGFESAPFKLTRDFVELLGGPTSRMFRTYRELVYRTFISLRKSCMEIILLVEMLKTGNEELPCFRGQPDEAIRQLRERFRLDLNDRACREYVNCLVDDSIENWRTDWYDRYQRYCVGVF